MSEQLKLQVLLLGLWLLLLLPTLFLGYQTYQRLQYEALHQYRTLAETLTDGMAGSLSLAIEQESARDPAEYRFTNGKVRSPLAQLTPASGLPGILGYFQVDAQGELSSPVMPVVAGGAADAAGVSGISVEELALRQLTFQRIKNLLLQDFPEPVVVKPTGLNDLAAQLPAEAQSELMDATDAAISGYSAEASVSAAPSRAASQSRQSVDAQRNQVLYEELSQADKPSVQQRDRQKTSAARKLALDTDFFSKSNATLSKQAAQERLSKAPRPLSRLASKPKPESTPNLLPNRIPKRIEKRDPKIGETEKRADRTASAPSGVTYGQSAADETRASGSEDAKVEVSLFGSTVTDFALRPLSANHLILFRRVWQSEQPVVQGVVLDRQVFFAGAITDAYRNSALSQVSDLAVAVDGQVQLTLAAGSADYSSGTRLIGGELLYRRYLGSPFGNLELLFSARELPLAAGASLVLWTLLVLVSLLCAGFILLYVLGKRQLQQRQQQQDFVSAVSHELKTPLTSIRMYGEMLKSGWVDEAKKPEYYDYIFNESERLSRLISNVLQLSSITRGRSDLQLAPLSVAQIVDLVRSRAAAQVKAQGYELKIVCDPAVASTDVVVDEDALLQVMINLVDNALKFSAGCVTKELQLNVTRENNDVVFSLRDFGPGIERGQLDKIFELFYRSENELTRETLGTGIGLALVQELVSAMGGRIAATNREPGAEFAVRLPV